MSDKHSGRLTRRRLLKSAVVAGAAVAVPQIIPASALGRGGVVAPSERIVMRAIGVGGRGSGDVNWIMGESDVQFVAVCDVSKSRRDAVKQAVDSRYGNKDCAVYGDLREFLAQRNDVDAVLIATGDRWHALASIMTMRAGKDVYCEKPACLTIAQGQAVVETARRYSRVYQTGAQRLSELNHIFAIEMARSGGLGKIQTVYADCRWRGGFRHDWLPPQAQPPKDEIDWEVWVGPSPWRPYNSGYLNSGWYNFYDLATDVAMWGAHSVAQAMAVFDISEVSSIDLEYAGPDATIETRWVTGGYPSAVRRSSSSVRNPITSCRCAN